MCVHLVELVDDCPECVEIFKLRRRVDSLKVELEESKKELSRIKNEQKRKCGCIKYTNECRGGWISRAFRWMRDQ